MNVWEIPNPIRYRLRLYKFSLQTDIASNTQLRLWMQHLDQFLQEFAIAVRRFHKNLSDAVTNLLLHDLKRAMQLMHPLSMHVDHFSLFHDLYMYQAQIHLR